MTITGQRIFITGGTGFIGTALCKQLADENELVVFDNCYRGKPQEKHLSHKNITVIQGDILDKSALLKSMVNCTYVIHLASIAGIDTTVKMPVKVMQVGIIGLFNVLDVAKDIKGVKRLINFSTSEIFGEFCYKPEEGECSKLGSVGEARWTYAVSKLAGEHLANNYSKAYGIPVTSVRPFNIYGPGQIGEGAVHNFVVRALNGDPLIIRNDGSQIRSWCYIDDIVDSMNLILTNEAAAGQIFNIGNPRSTLTIAHLAEMIVSLSDSSSDIVYQKWDGADIGLRIPNVEKARNLLGFEPKVDLKEGLLKTIEWYRQSSKQNFVQRSREAPCSA